ncbi:MAG: hypothetical protein RL595_1187 [Planctomycetota bacterium]
MTFFLLLLLSGFQNANPITPSEPIQFQISRISNIIDSSGNRYSRAEISATWDKDFRPILMDAFIHEVSVQGDGEKIPAKSMNGSSWFPVDSLGKTTLELTLPSLRKHQFMALAGKIRAIVPYGWKDLELGSLNQALENPKDIKPVLGKNGFSCRVTQLLEKPARVSIQVDVKLPSGGPELDTSQNWAILNEMKVLQGDKALPPLGQVIDLLESERVIITYHFDARPFKADREGKWNIIYTSPAGIEKKEIPFSFAKVPLP